MVLEGAGYVHLSSPIIRRRAAIGITFNARSPNGLVLMRAPSDLILDNEADEDDDEDQNYLALVLVDGEIQFE